MTTFRVPVEELCFRENVPAGMDVLVLMSLAAMMRKTSEDPEPVLVRPCAIGWRVWDDRHRAVAAINRGPERRALRPRWLTRGEMGMIEQLREWQRRIDALPPKPTAIVTHHSVPYGRAFRQWDTRGRLVVWVNRGEVEDLPRAKVSATGLAALTGIPVRHDP